MHDLSYLKVILILLSAAVLVVAIFRQMNLSPVLGYLFAGALIGPSGFAIVTDVHGTASIAEFGVVFLLFVIGLELSFERLKAMRRHVFGLGTMQVAITAGLIGGLVLMLGFMPKAAIIIGCGLAFSSTALVLQVVSESSEKSSQVGRLSLAILILQDLAVLPLLVLVPLLQDTTSSIGMVMLDASLRATVALITVFIAGRILLRPLFRIAASLKNPEIFTALTLLIVLGISYGLYQAAGLSLALGAFVAGLLVAETEYKHQVEADILPYKALLLGLFFMAVGMQIDLALMKEEFYLIIALSLALMVGKAAIITALARWFGFSKASSLQTGMLLSQGGEFGFILFQLAAKEGIIDSSVSQVLLVVVTATMALTPAFFTLATRLIARLEKTAERQEDPSAEVLDIKDHVVILGFGRVGQTVGKLLTAENIPYVAIDGNSAISAAGQKNKLPVYYGDGARREILQAMGLLRARAAIVTVNHFESAERMVGAIRAIAPNLPIVARTVDLKQLHKLELAGVNVAVSEMFEASIELGAALLRVIGVVDSEVVRITQEFRKEKYSLARQSVDMRVADQPHTPKLELFAFRKAKVYQSFMQMPPKKD